MSLVLNIDTALETASVSLAREGNILASETHAEPRDHAGWLHPAIERIMHKAGHPLSGISAVAVSIGPGSYTGLRVGLSSAKGFCYALGVPLITVGTLEILAATVCDSAAGLICPMIDARRMEVYAAIYDNTLKEIIPPQARVLDADSFSELLSKEPVLFTGNGIVKFQPLVNHPHASFANPATDPQPLAHLSFQYLQKGKIADLAYTEPLYIKEFYSPTRKN